MAVIRCLGVISGLFDGVLSFVWMLSAGWSRAREYSRKVRAPEGALPGNAWAVSKDADG